MISYSCVEIKSLCVDFNCDYNSKIQVIHISLMINETNNTKYVKTICAVCATFSLLSSVSWCGLHSVPTATGRQSSKKPKNTCGSVVDKKSEVLKVV